MRGPADRPRRNSRRTSTKSWSIGSGDVWERDRNAGRASEFVNLADEDLEDAIQRDAWELIPAETRDYIREKFGADSFMVRRDMVNNTVGYRSISVADAWIGPSRDGRETGPGFPGRRSG